MVRPFATAVALAFCVGAAHAQPSEADIATYRAKLAEYVAKTEDSGEICRGLVGWFGWPFYAVPDSSTGTVDYFVKAPTHGPEIRYLRVIGSVKLSAPRVLMEPTK